MAKKETPSAYQKILEIKVDLQRLHTAYDTDRLDKVEDFLEDARSAVDELIEIIEADTAEEKQKAARAYIKTINGDD